MVRRESAGTAGETRLRKFFAEEDDDWERRNKG